MSTTTASTIAIRSTAPSAQPERDRQAQQEAHEASVKRQRGKLKIAPWRNAPEFGDGVTIGMS
jgi:hypothetical protein